MSETPLTRVAFEADLAARLDAHRSAHPEAQAEDIVKFAFQGMLGVGHLLGSAEAVEAYIEREARGLSPDPAAPLAEPLSPAWGRLHLRRAMAEGLTPRIIAKMMLCSAPTSPEWTRDDVIRFCRGYAEARGLSGMEGALAPLGDPTRLPGHSPAFRERYDPAYRVISADWLPRLPVITTIMTARAAAGRRLLVTLDGPCASGKTTLAARLADALDAAVVHTDDFVIPHKQKTPERLAVPGGNCDAERLENEVLRPWASGQTVSVRAYDCRADRLRPPVTLPDTGVLILEGSYCNLPALRRYADVRLFMRTPPDTCLSRLEKRESPASLRNFRERWIPLENTYFAAYGLPDEECIQV